MFRVYVSKDELSSAITLGGVQLNIAGIAGPALGGFLLPLLGAPLLISINALAFLLVALAVLRWKPRPVHPGNLRESFRESFVSSFRYANSSARFKIILFRISSSRWLSRLSRRCCPSSHLGN